TGFRATTARPTSPPVWRTVVPRRPGRGRSWSKSKSSTRPRSSWRRTSSAPAPEMARVLVTGMSGTGKSTALAELARRGFRVVDTDSRSWSEWARDADGGRGEWLWREDRMAELLAKHENGTLYVSGCMSNQGRLYDRFEAVVLLSAPAAVILGRL